MPLQSLRMLHVSTLLVLASALCAPQRAVSQTAGDPAAALLKQGTDELMSRHYEDAIKSFKKANQLQHETCASCYFEWAVAQSRLGDTDGALKNCDKAISCAKDDNVRVLTHTLKGNILLQTAADAKRLKAAESEYRAVLELQTNNAMAHLNLGVTLLRESQQAEGTQELNSYLRIDPEGRSALYARKLIANPEHASQTLAPPFKVQTLDGQEISSDDLSGKVVVMDFWATWCGPCVSSVPELKELTKKYPRTKLVLISFSADRNQQAWREFITKKNMEWPQYWDSDGRIRDAFGVNAFPTYLVIDQDGFIHERIVGLNPQQSIVSRLKTTLQTMLQSD